jgi:hypothetical protein
MKLFKRKKEKARAPSDEKSKEKVKKTKPPGQKKKREIILTTDPGANLCEPE